MEIINKFEGEYEFLSNFAYSPFEVNGVTYQTNEHFFQATKAINPEDQKTIALADTPGKAKRYGRKIALRSDWEIIKEDVMRCGLAAKFRQNPELMRKLIDTGDAILIEGTSWHDNYWGNCYCDKCANIQGKNRLGELLMELRTAERKYYYDK